MKFSRLARRRLARRGIIALLLPLLLIPFAVSCGGPGSAMKLGWSPDSPAVYRVDASADSGFSGPVSDLDSKTRFSAAFKVTPISGNEARVEVIYLSAGVSDGEGRAPDETSGLALGDLSGSAATIRFGPPGVVSSVEDFEGDDRLLDARIPLVSMRDVISSLFPPLPEGSFRSNDTWTGDAPPPFPALGADPTRMRYVAHRVSDSGRSGRVEGYELSAGPRPFSVETAGGSVTGEGNLDVRFDGDLQTEDGYQTTRRTSTFETNYIRLEGGGYANGNLKLRSEVRVEKLNPAEQFGLDVG